MSKGSVKAPVTASPLLPAATRLLCTSNGSCDLWQLGQHAPLSGNRGGTAAGGHFGGGLPSAALASRSKWQTQQRGEGCTVDLIQVCFKFEFLSNDV